jgi:predicted HAD superfamily Cof-like phosphohydrolase
VSGRQVRTWRCTLECDGMTWHGTGTTPESATAEALYLERTDASHEETFGSAVQSLHTAVSNLQAHRDSQTRPGAAPSDLVDSVHAAIERLRLAYAERYRREDA